MACLWWQFNQKRFSTF